MSCPRNKIVNPETGRCVLRTGAIGKRILSETGARSRSLSTTRARPRSVKLIGTRSGKGYGGLLHGSIKEKKTGRERTEDDFSYGFDGTRNEYDIINDKLAAHFTAHLNAEPGNYDRKSLNKEGFNWQSGFGGDEGNGEIDFFLPKKIKMLSPMSFRINNVDYIMTFSFGGDE